MTSSDNTARLLLCPGELRPDLLRLFGVPVGGIDCLVAAPGMLRPFRGQTELVLRPSTRMPAGRAMEHRAAIFADLDHAIDQLPRTVDWEREIQAWIEGLHDGRVQVRHADRMPLHTRLVSHADESVLPQAPLTLASADAADELVLKLAGAEHTKARDWFHGKFDGAVEMSQEVREHLLASWAGGWSTAEDVYYKVLSEYFRGVVLGLDFETDDNPMLEHLTDFQRDAYLYGKTILQRFGGVFLADVVGLGKTFIALALLNHLQRRYGEHAVVVAPPAVLPAWEALAREFRIELALVSLGKLDDLDLYADREILVIDESHNFRNEGTQRSGRIHQWLRPDGASSRRKVILLSATPQNNAATDVKAQLAMFPDNFARLPYRGETLDAWFREVTAGNASLVDMLQHVVVRRTRNYIKSAHPDAKIRIRSSLGEYEEKPLHFPVRVSGEAQTLRYSIDATYGSAFYEKLLAAIGTMTYPLHGLGQYVRENAADHPILRRLRRISGTSLRGLYKVLLLKRLESSVVALHATLSRLVDKLNIATASLARGEVLVRHGHLASDDADDAVLLSEKGESVIGAEHFEARQLQSDLESDLKCARALLEGTTRLLSQGDHKATRLKEYLKARPPTEHRTLIFTQFADTAAHLATELGPTFGRTEVVTGSSSSVLDIARRFAPRASRVSVPADRQIDLLISTDVLSEGVNLQDADTLINYDIHWNPVRLIQRAGRIDRIGSEHDEIHVSSFLPERALEDGLGLEAVLRKRIDEFVAVFGEDSHVLPSQERIELDPALATYTGAALQADESPDDLDGLSRHIERLLALRRDDPVRYGAVLEQRLGRRAIGGAGPAVVALRRAWYWTFWTSKGKSGGLSQMDVLRAFDTFYRHTTDARDSATPGHLGLGLDLIAAAEESFRPLAEEFAQQRTYPRLTPAETFVLDQLQRYATTCPPAQKALLDELREWVKQGHAQVAVARSGRNWRKSKLSAQAVFDEVRVLRAQFPARTEDLGEPEVVGAVLPGEG